MIDSKWDCMVRNHLSRHVTVLFHITEITKKILSDHNTCIVLLFNRLHGNIIHIVIVTSLILLLAPYHPSTLRNMIMIVLTELNNNVNEQLTLGLRKLMEETTFIFWVDL